MAKRVFAPNTMKYFLWLLCALGLVVPYKNVGEWVDENSPIVQSAPLVLSPQLDRQHFGSTRRHLPPGFRSKIYDQWGHVEAKGRTPKGARQRAHAKGRTWRLISSETRVDWPLYGAQLLALFTVGGTIFFTQRRLMRQTR